MVPFSQIAFLLFLNWTLHVYTCISIHYSLRLTSLIPKFAILHVFLTPRWNYKLFVLHIDSWAFILLMSMKLVCRLIFFFSNWKFYGHISSDTAVTQYDVIMTVLLLMTYEGKSKKVNYDHANALSTQSNIAITHSKTLNNWPGAVISCNGVDMLMELFLAWSWTKLRLIVRAVKLKHALRVMVGHQPAVSPRGNNCRWDGQP